MDNNDHNKKFEVHIDYDNEFPEQNNSSGSKKTNNKADKAQVKKGWSKKKKGFLIAGVIIGIILIMIGCVVGLIFHYIGKVNVVSDSSSYEILDSIAPDDDLTSEPDSPEEDKAALEDSVRANLEANATELVSDDNVYNILLIGTDARQQGERGRSDSMILVSINKNTDKIVMTSFLRDIYLAIPDKGSTRLNHSYAYGGPDLLIDTLEQNFNIRIDKYVQVNFYSFVKVVDAIGGVDIDVTDAEVQYVNAYLEEINKLEGISSNDGALSSGGSYTLNGRQALAYSRIRYIGTDFGRTERQRTVLTKVIEKMKNSSLTELNDLLNVLLPQLTTNLTEGEMFSMVLNSPSYLSYGTEQYAVPEDGTFSYLTIDSMSVLGIDFEQNIADLKKHIYG